MNMRYFIFGAEGSRPVHIFKFDHDECFISYNPEEGVFVMNRSGVLLHVYACLEEESLRSLMDPDIKAFLFAMTNEQYEKYVS